MKDAKGHGSEKRGAHAAGTNEVGRLPLTLHSTASTPQRQGHWFDRQFNDQYVYHGTDMEHIEGIKKDGLQSFLRNYFATDPKVAMQYGFRANIHHSSAGESADHPFGAAKRAGVLLRVHKSVVDSEAYQKGQRKYDDFWTGPSEIKPEHIEMRHQGKWKKLA